MAAWYDQPEAVRLLLDHGVDVSSRPRADGQTALHVAAYQGNVNLVRFLLRRGAPTNVLDDVHGTTPLVRALHAWLVDHRPNEAARRAVLLMLVDAAADVDARWIEDERILADRELYALLAARANAG